MHHDYDIVVVGAGPAGISAAGQAAERGMKVALLEMQEAIGQHVRTSGVTWLETVKNHRIPAELYNEIDNFKFYSPGNEVSLHDTNKRAVVLDVRRTYQFLASRAAEEGVEIYLKTRVNRVEKGDGKSVIASSLAGEESFKAGIVIDASGFTTVVGREVGMAQEYKRFGAGAEYEAIVENIDPSSWIIMVGKIFSPAGYAWIFPLGENRARIGVGVGRPESQEDPVDILLKLIERRPSPFDKLGKITPIEFHYGLIPNEGLREDLIFENIMLVGDAAGQANPLVLEGIRYALEYGKIAGRMAADALKNGSTDGLASLARYESECKRNIGPKIRAALKVQKRWLTLDDEHWDEEVEIIKELSNEEFFDFITANFNLTSVIKLATKHPRLAARQLFDAVRSIMAQE
ncbi:MAG: NAD(P)/FAD-dependent oxidoreductase [Conexivisphaerales archaeon]